VKSTVGLFEEHSTTWDDWCGQSTADSTWCSVIMTMRAGTILAVICGIFALISLIVDALAQRNKYSPCLVLTSVCLSNVGGLLAVFVSFHWPSNTDVDAPGFAFGFAVLGAGCLMTALALASVSCCCKMSSGGGWKGMEGANLHDGHSGGASNVFGRWSTWRPQVGGQKPPATHGMQGPSSGYGQWPARNLRNPMANGMQPQQLQSQPDPRVPYVSNGQPPANYMQGAHQPPQSFGMQSPPQSFGMQQAAGPHGMQSPPASFYSVPSPPASFGSPGFQQPPTPAPPGDFGVSAPPAGGHYAPQPQPWGIGKE